jgi:hypothetical protein
VGSRIRTESVAFDTKQYPRFEVVCSALTQRDLRDRRELMKVISPSLHTASPYNSCVETLIPTCMFDQLLRNRATTDSRSDCAKYKGKTPAFTRTYAQKSHGKADEWVVRSAIPHSDSSASTSPLARWYIAWSYFHRTFECVLSDTFRSWPKSCLAWVDTSQRLL